jgi:hypothetical protein
MFGPLKKSLIQIFVDISGRAPALWPLWASHSSSELCNLLWMQAQKEVMSRVLVFKHFSQSPSTYRSSICLKAVLRVVRCLG